MDIFRDPETMEPEELRAYLADVREELEVMDEDEPEDETSEEFVDWAERHEELEDLAERVSRQLQAGMDLFRRQSNDPAALQVVEDAEEEIDNLTEALREHHVDRLKNRKCSAKNGMLYLDLLTNLERIGDHAENIATSVDKNR